MSNFFKIKYTQYKKYSILKNYYASNFQIIEIINDEVIEESLSSREKLIRFMNISSKS